MRYRHKGFNNRHTYSDRGFDKKSNSGYFAVYKYEDRVYIEVLEIIPESENSSVLRFYGFEPTHLERLIANTFHACKLEK